MKQQKLFKKIDHHSWNIKEHVLQPFKHPDTVDFPQGCKPINLWFHQTETRYEFDFPASKGNE